MTTSTATAKQVSTAIYYNADSAAELVTLDSTDCVLEVVRTLTDDDLDAIYAGDTEYRTDGLRVHIGDGDSYQRLALR